MEVLHCFEFPASRMFRVGFTGGQNPSCCEDYFYPNLVTKTMDEQWIFDCVERFTGLQSKLFH